MKMKKCLQDTERIDVLALLWHEAFRVGGMSAELVYRLRPLASACFTVAVCTSATVSAQSVPLPPGQVVIGPIGNTAGPAVPSITTGAQANFYTGSIVGGFIPSAPVTVVRTSAPTQFVRFYNRNNNDTLGPAVGPWIATSNSVRGMTAAQVKNILALPDTPTSVALVQVPTGTCVFGGPGNPALGNFPANPPAVPTAGPWGAAGAPQYYIVGQNPGSGCATPQDLAASNYITNLNMGTFALAYTPNAGTGNSAAVAAALDQAIYPAPFTPMDGVYNSLDVLNFTDPMAFRAALSQLSGEINADLTSVSIESSRVFLNMLGHRLRGASKGGGPSSTGDAAVSEDGKARAWIDASANDVAIRGDGNTHDFGLNVAAVVAGLDYQIDPAMKVGAALGYTRSGFATSGVYGTGSADSYHGALYGSYAAGPLLLSGIAGFAISDFNINRVISFPGQQGTTTAQTSSAAFISAVELGYRFQPRADTTLSPIAGLQFIGLQQNAFSERGAGPLDLNVAQTNLASLRSLLGAELTHDIALGDSTLLQARVRLAWAHDFTGTDRTVNEVFQQLMNTTFQVTGAEPSRDAAVLSVGLATTGPVQFFFRYDGQYSAAQTNHGGSAGLTVRF